MDEISKEIIQNIKKKRKEKRFALKELAEMIGVKYATMSTYETVRAPDVSSLYKICKALDISISELFGKYSNEKEELLSDKSSDKEQEKFSSEEDEKQPSSKISEILNKSENLNEEGQDKLIEFIELLEFKYKKKLDTDLTAEEMKQVSNFINLILRNR